jgi:hypothetical protein
LLAGGELRAFKHTDSFVVGRRLAVCTYTLFSHPVTVFLTSF